MEENTHQAPQPQVSLPADTDFSPQTKRWLGKIAIILIALVLFQIPLYMVRELNGKRQSQALAVQYEIADSWGKEQTVQLSPKAFSENISAEIIPEIRYRGIYQAAVYTAKIKITSEYRNLPSDTTGTINISDIKGIIDAQAVINGKDTKIGKDLKFALPQGDSKCEILLTLRGCGKLLFAPGAQTSSIAITGNWESPGFTGDILPETREISNGNFSAQWNIGKFNAAVGHAGVELCIPAGSYQQVERCFTYATFFLIVFFFTLLAAELITKIYIHAVQYVVAAGAPVLFYLMTLAFSERAGFTAGYIISAAVIVTMVTMYARMFLRRTLPALAVGTIFAASYLLNFIILRLEDLALISGTIVLAIILGTVMSLTGKLNRKTSDDGTL
jgi:inner membrane protein